MRRIFVLALASAGMLIGSLAMAGSDSRKSPAHLKAVIADGSQCLDPAHCPKGCRAGQARSSASKVATMTHGTMSSAICPNDPSKCPSWCRPSSGASSASAKVTHAKVAKQNTSIMAAKVESR